MHTFNNLIQIFTNDKDVQDDMIINKSAHWYK